MASSTFKARMATAGMLFLWFLAALAFLMSFLPVLYTFVLALAVPAGAAAALIAYLRREDHLGEARPGAYFLGMVLRLGRAQLDASQDRLTLRAHRTFRLALLALIVNALLYSVVGFQSWACNIRTFDRELEPLRKAFRTMGAGPVRSGADRASQKDQGPTTKKVQPGKTAPKTKTP